MAMSAAVLLSGAAAGIALWYNSENKLKYEEVQGGYSVTSGRFYRNSVSGKVEIPSAYNNKPIIEIGENAFKNFDKVTEFAIPYSVTKIADSAFYDCDNLQKVSFAQNTATRAAGESSLQTIGARAFYDCGKLSDFAIPYGVALIGDEAFAGSALTKADIPDTVEYIGAEAFANCKFLTTVTVGDRDEIPARWHADWSKNNSAEVQYSLRITFAYNGATGNAATTEQYVIFGKNFSFPVPNKTGYTFDGWYYGDTKLTNNSGQSVTVWNFTTGGRVEAHFAANENKVIFNGNGATGGAMSEQKIKTDESAALSANKFVRKGYTFAGWATSTNGNAQYSDKASYKMGTGSSYTLYAVWTPNTNTVIFNANGGSGSMQSQSIKTDASAKLSDNAFTRKGYDFIGWATSANGGVVYANNASYTMGTESSYTLYAVWKIHNYTISYNLGGGTVNGNPTQYNVESNAFTLVNPTRAGYTFAGWTGTGLSSATQTVTLAKGSTGERTYTATWRANVNTITFHANGGDGEMAQQQIETDATAKLNANAFTRAGYDFVGWAISENGNAAYVNKDNYVTGAENNYDLFAVWGIKNNSPRKDFEYTKEDFYYNNYYVRTNVTITNYIGEANIVEIPATISGMPVVRVQSLGDSNKVQKIIISGDIPIDSGAFRRLSSLISVQIGKNVKTYSLWNLLGNKSNNLREIYVEEGNERYHCVDNCLVETDSKTLIMGCNNSIIPKDGSVTTIAAYAFHGCNTLKNITVPDSVTSIGRYAFTGCSGLTSIVIPDSVTSIGNYAFSDCNNVILYCEAEAQPSGWDSNWNSSNLPVIWGYKEE